jgi:hypothetical protein|tara:strand:+ start:40 stop:357 length:318 start_codon:yes stop_codon:yes gene_type:complete
MKYDINNPQHISDIEKIINEHCRKIINKDKVMLVYGGLSRVIKDYIDTIIIEKDKEIEKLRRFSYCNCKNPKLDFSHFKSKEFSFYKCRNCERFRIINNLSNNEK